MTLYSPTRRGFIRGASLILAAPAIVRFSSLMPVKAIEAAGPVAWYWNGSEVVWVLANDGSWWRGQSEPFSVTVPESALAPRGRD